MLSIISEDPHLVVKDTAIWAISQICNFPQIIEQNVGPIVQTLLRTLTSPNPSLASQACYVSCFPHPPFFFLLSICAIRPL